MKKKIIILMGLMVLLSGCLNQTVKDVFVTPIKPDVIETTSFIYNPGAYRGMALGNNGNIEVEVTVNETSILAIDIISHQETDYIVQIKTEAPEGENELGEELPSEEPQNEIQDKELINEGEELKEEKPIEEQKQIVQVMAVFDSIINEIIATQSLNVDASLYLGAEPSGKGLIEAIRVALDNASLS